MNRIWQVLQELKSLESPNRLKFYLVGGCIRNLLIKQPVSDIDMVCVGDFDVLVEALSRTYKIDVSPLKTLSFEVDTYEFAIATPRRESYPMKNGVPLAKFDADLKEDSIRRDFTVNTAVVPLSSESIGWFEGAFPSQEEIYNHIALAHPLFKKDMASKCLRILHEDSFSDDPSRLMRAVKYSYYYGFTLSEATLDQFDSTLINHLDTGRYLRILWSYAFLPRAEAFFSVLEDYRLIEDYTEIIKKFSRVAALWNIHSFEWKMIYFYAKFHQHWLPLTQLSGKFSKMKRDLDAIFVGFDGDIGLKNAYESYKILYNKTVESIVYAYISGIGQMEIDRFMRLDHKLSLKISGKDLIDVGMTEGAELGALMERLLKFKLENKAELSKDEELNWIIKVAHENRS